MTASLIIEQRKLRVNFTFQERASDTINRGIENRGIENRGIENRGIENRKLNTVQQKQRVQKVINIDRCLSKIRILTLL
jgi:hypothetical protein